MNKEPKTLARLVDVDEQLEREKPGLGWKYTGNYLCYEGTVWLHYSCAAERRMYWVKARNPDQLVMTWDIGEIKDLI